MNQASDIYFTIGLPIALAMVVAVVLLSGRLEPETRTKVERVLAAIFYPAVVIYWAWKAYEYAAEADWMRAALMAGVGVLFAWMGVRAFRAGRLAPQGERRS